MRRADLEPLVPYPGAAVAWPCVHAPCGRTVAPLYNTVQQGKGGCRYCAHASFAGVPSVIYTIVNVELGIVKVGIARAKSRRVAEWQAHGWILVRQWSLADGADALRIEQSVHRWWRDEVGAPIGVAQEVMGTMAGYTETAPLWAVDLDETLVRIEKAIADF